MVPPSAASNFPTRSRIAPVNAPLTCPKSSLSSRFSGIAAQLTATNGPRERGDRPWMARATSSFPVPLSPRIRTVVSVGATRRIISTICRIPGLSATMLSRSLRDFSAWRSTTFSRCSASSSSALRMVSFSSSRLKGLLM